MSGSACRTCWRPIIWAVNAKDRAIPMDPPDGEGDHAVSRLDTGQLFARPLRNGEALFPREERMSRHWDTCPVATRHHHPRRPRR